MRSWWRERHAAEKGNLLVSISTTHEHRPREEKLQATLWGILPIHANGDWPSPPKGCEPGDWELEMEEPAIHEDTAIEFDSLRTLVSIEAVSVGGGHVIFVAREGRAFAYGCNVHGQLGVGDFENRTIPCPVQGLSASPHPSPTKASPLGEASEGGGQFWENVQEGPKDGSTGAWAFVSAAACGQDHTVFLARRGAGLERQRLFACGAFDALGLDSEHQENRPRPQMLPEPVGGVAIAARGLTSCCVAPMPSSADPPELAVSSDRRSPRQFQFGDVPPAREHWIYLWGEVQCCPRPGLFELPTPFFRLPAAAKVVSLGTFFGLALDVLGFAYTWGDGSYGELGSARWSEPPCASAVFHDAGGHGELPLPRRITLPAGRPTAQRPSASGNGTEMSRTTSVGGRQQRPHVVDIACGERHALLLDENGRLYAFGENFSGQCGVAEPGGNSAIVNRPRLVSVPPARANADTPVGLQVFAGRRHSAMIAEGGRLYMWGHPANRKLAHAGINPDGTEAGENPSKPRPPGVAVRSPLRDAVRQPRLVHSLQRNLQTLALGDECSILVTGSDNRNSLRVSSSESSDHGVPADRREFSLYVDGPQLAREPPALAPILPSGEPPDTPPGQPTDTGKVAREPPPGQPPSQALPSCEPLVTPPVSARIRL